MGRERGLARVAVAGCLALAGAVALAGCVSLNPLDPSKTAKSIRGDGDPLRTVLSRKDDLLPKETIIATSRGRQVTMDFCAGEFPSEANRRAGWDVLVFPDHDIARDDPVGFREGTVVERSARYEPGKAKVALDELRMAVARCDPEAWIPGGPYGYDSHDDVQDEAPSLKGLPADAVVVPYRETVAYDLGDATSEKLLVAMRRGDVVVVIDGDPLRTTIIVEDAARRLAALSPDEVGG